MPRGTHGVYATVAVHFLEYAFRWIDVHIHIYIYKFTSFLYNPYIHTHTHTHTDAAGWKYSGNDFFSKKLFAEAVSCYTSGLSSLNQQHPTFVPLLLNIAAACLGTHEPRDALAWSLAALQISSSHVKAAYRTLAAMQAIMAGTYNLMVRTRLRVYL
jgi:hypothetical protein